jgi:type II secretion system protein C
MPKLSNSKILSIMTKVLVAVLLAKIVSLGVWWYLPSSGIEQESLNSYTQSYKRIDFKNMLEKSKVIQDKRQIVSTTNINTIVLSGLYGKGKNGFAIVAKKSSPTNTSVISVGEVYEGYTLSSIEAFSVTFVKNSKEYIVRIDTKKLLDTKKYVTTEERQSATYAVQKNDINFYRKNPTKIWQDVAINEVVQGKKITGFRVDRINKNSKIAQLGLQKGDVIIRANNITLNSYKAAMDLYKNIDTIDTLELVVLRNNQEKEIIYEIH